MGEQDTLSLLLGHLVPVSHKEDPYQLVTRRIMIPLEDSDYHEILDFKKQLLALEGGGSYYKVESMFCQILTNIANIVVIDTIFYRWAIQFYEHDEVSNDIEFLTEGFYEALNDIQYGLSFVNYDDIDDHAIDDDLFENIQLAVSEFMINGQFIGRTLIDTLVNTLNYFPVLMEEAHGANEFLVNPIEISQVDLRSGYVILEYETFDPESDLSWLKDIAPHQHQGLRHWRILSTS